MTWGNFPSSEKKKSILLNQIFILCSLCAGTIAAIPSRSLLAGISCSGMTPCRLEEIDLMARKVASNVDTFLFFVLLFVFAPNFLYFLCRKENKGFDVCCFYPFVCMSGYLYLRQCSRQVFSLISPL